MKVVTWIGATKHVTERYRKRTALAKESDKAKRARQPRKTCCEAVRKRSGGWCEIKWPGCEVYAVHVHEIIPRSQGGSIVDPENCKNACFSCHSALHKRPNEARKQGFLKDNYGKNNSRK